MLDNPRAYIRGLDREDVEALLMNLAKTDGLSKEDIDSIDDGPEWLQALDRNARE